MERGEWEGGSVMKAEVEFHQKRDGGEMSQETPTISAIMRVFRGGGVGWAVVGEKARFKKVSRMVFKYAKNPPIPTNPSQKQRYEPGLNAVIFWDYLIVPVSVRDLYSPC